MLVVICACDYVNIAHRKRGLDDQRASLLVHVTRSECGASGPAVVVALHRQFSGAGRHLRNTEIAAVVEWMKVTSPVEC